MDKRQVINSEAYLREDLGDQCPLRHFFAIIKENKYIIPKHSIVFSIYYLNVYSYFVNKKKKKKNAHFSILICILKQIIIPKS